MGKFISWLVLALFVLVVPLGSWYYLKMGLNYRKNALKELIAKDSISVTMDSLGLLNKKTTLLALHSSKTIEGNLVSIHNQFKNIDGFQIFTFDSIHAFNILPEGYLSGFRNKYEGKDYILLDTSIHIRNTYSNTEEDVKKLVEHLAIIIPRPKEYDIKMKK
ncbi:MAG: hypothetical protein H7X99_02995 [Saprospiraceae bacterium]|nr:hypothetical protein [Saprospiraceae bacterium]